MVSTKQHFEQKTPGWYPSSWVLMVSGGKDRIFNRREMKNGLAYSTKVGFKGSEEREVESWIKTDSILLCVWSLFH